jgi:uncharacterized repeat protein (TIGR02543 family)
MRLKKKIFTFILASGLFLSACNGSSNVSSEYNVYFFTANVNADIVDTIFNQQPGTKIVKPDNPTRSGFDFVGWYLDVGLTNDWDFLTDVMPEASIVLYAKWEVGIKTIVYRLNGGEMTTENYQVEFSPGDNVVLPQARRVGYTFKGWFDYDQNFVLYPNSEGTRPGDKPIVTITASAFSNIILFAHWAVIQTNVSFRANHPGGTTVVPNPGTIRFPYGSTIIFGTNFPADFGNVAGFRFLGWNSKADGTGDSYNNNTVFLKTSPITIFGQWQLVA